MKTKYILGTIFLTACSSLSAQNLNSAYFLDGYANGHEINPAKDYDRQSYFSFPLLGNINIATRGNIGLGAILMKNPNGKGLITYMHPSISIDDAMSNFHNNNKMLVDTRMEIVSFGFHAKGAFHTVTMGLRSNMGVNLPYELFELSKNVENRDYDFGDMGLTATTWAEIGYGYSRNVTDAIRVGGKFKFLIGAGYANVKMHGLRLDVRDPNSWLVTAKATAEVGIKGFSWGEHKIKEYNSRPGEYYEQLDLDNMDVENPGLNGWGMALDMGAEWDLGKQSILDGMKLSVSLLDIGFVKWKNVSTAYNNGEDFVLNFEDIKIKDGEGTTLGDQFDKFGDQLSDLICLQEGEHTSKARALGATLNIGAEYKMPFYDKLKAGFLSTTRIQGVYSWNEERLHLAVSPHNSFEVAGNVGVGTLGCTAGWIINIHPKGFNLYMGMDYVLGKLTKQYVPLRSNSNISVGINFPLGKSRI